MSDGTLGDTDIFGPCSCLEGCTEGSCVRGCICLPCCIRKSPLNSAGSSPLVGNPPDDLSLAGQINEKKLIGESSGGGAEAEISKRKRPEGFNYLTSAKGKNTKKGRRCRIVTNGGPSEAKPREDQSIEQLLKKRSVGEVIKVLMDRIHRRINNDKMADMGNCVRIMRLKIMPPLLDSVDAINWEKWPERIDLKNIIDELDKIKKEASQMKEQGKEEDEVKNEMEQRLKDVERDIKKSDKKRQEDSSKAADLVRLFFTGEMYSTQFLKEKFSEAFPWLFNGETAATNRPTTTTTTTTEQSQGSSWQTPEYSEQKYTFKDGVEELENKLFANNQKEVEISDFVGLEEAVKSAGGGIPEHLKAIATRIQEACGEQVTRYAYCNILILVCAAINEMEQYLGFETLNLDRLLTWGATYNLATKFGFQLQFVEKHLKKILYAYHCFDFRKGGEGDPEERVRQLEADLRLMKWCISAEKSFQGKPLSHGLFP